MDKRSRQSSKAKPGINPAPPDMLLDAGRFDPAQRERLGAPGLRSFAAISERWGLTEVQRLSVLGFPGRSTYHQWLAKARSGEKVLLPVDTLLRISAVLGIHKGLRILLGREEDARAWLTKPHDAPLFGGQPPLTLVVSGTQDGLMLVRRYLDAWRGGMFAAPNAADSEPPYTDDDIVLV